MNLRHRLSHISTLAGAINIMDMNLVLALTILMLTRLDGSSVATVCLLHCLVPDQIILTVDFWPGWNQYFLEAIWSDYITNDRIKGTRNLVLIFNTEHTAWTRLMNLRHRLSHISTLARAINIMDMHLVLALTILVLARLDGGSVTTVCLLHCLVPN